MYGNETLSSIHDLLKEEAPDVEFEFKQTNSEAELITWIGDAPTHYAGLIINPAALTHTSLGIYDALKAIGNQLPTVEVHLSNTHTREEIRHKSLQLAPALDKLWASKAIAMYSVLRPCYMN